VLPPPTPLSSVPAPVYEGHRDETRGGWGRLSAVQKESPMVSSAAFSYGDARKRTRPEETRPTKPPQPPASPEMPAKRRQSDLVPRFVDIIRREPAQTRAAETARNIMSSLDQITSGAVRVHAPPRPLRKSVSHLASSVRPQAVGGRTLAELLGGLFASGKPDDRDGGR
jgi:hypothetical protein